MIKWLKNKVHEWTRDTDIDEIDFVRSTRLQSGYIRLDLYIGVGGYVVESIIYDKVKDEDMVSLYIINEGENLGDRITKIITSEQLKLR